MTMIAERYNNHPFHSYKPTVLVVDDETDVRNVIKRFLSSRGYDPLTASCGREALGKLKVQRPDIVLLDVNMPEMDGFTVCKKLREDPSTNLTPVLMLTARSGIEDRVMGLNTGADDYLPKPFELMELEARMDVLLRRTRNMIFVNPLTQLPGGPNIQEEIEARIQSGEKFAVCLMDIDNFKAYNDVYGFHHGDMVLLWTAKMIQSVVNDFKGGSAPSRPHFLGHIGGDDFVLVSDLDSARNLSQDIADRFDLNREMWYNFWDKLKGCIQSEDRQGNLRKFPFMTLTLAVSTNEKKNITHYAQVAQITSELKKFAKQRPETGKSAVLFDRRSSS